MNKAFRHALRDIFGDGALIIFMVIVPIVYPIVYALIYNTEAVHEVPVVVVDKAGNATSRDFLNRLNASPDVHIAAHATSLEPPRPQWRTAKPMVWSTSPRFRPEVGTHGANARERLLRHERYALL